MRRQWWWTWLGCCLGLFFLGNVVLLYYIQNRDPPSPTKLLSFVDFSCLNRVQAELNVVQLEARRNGNPILSSIVPTDKGLQVLFIMKHIPNDQYNMWYKARWYCSLSSPAVMLGSDPHFHTLSIVCPPATQSISVHNAQYDVPPNLCPWTFQPAYLSACTMVQGTEALAQLSTWIAYHRVLGIEQFYIYANEPMKDPPFRHVAVHWIPFQDPFNSPFFVQQAMQNDCIARARFRSAWVALMDVDEFFQPMGSHSTSRLLAMLKPFESKSIGGLAIKNWFFGRHPGDTATEDEDGGLVFARYIWRAPHAIRSGREKMIVQPTHVIYFSVHTITLGEPMHTMDAIMELRMNHYRRPQKGVWGYYKRQAWSKLVRDDSMRRYLKPVKRELEQFVA